MAQEKIEIGRLTKAAYLPKPRVNSWWFMTDENCQSKVHFWYGIPSIQDEVEKRSSFLGKCRRTEETAHLLDLIAMTKDETELFIPFLKKAAAQVFDVLEKYTDGVKDAYEIQHLPECVIHYRLRLPYSTNENNVKTADEAIFETLVDYILFEWLSVAYPNEANTYLAKATEDQKAISNRLGNFNQSIVHKVPRIL